jgi:hypothetical protein
VNKIYCEKFHTKMIKKIRTERPKGTFIEWIAIDDMEMLQTRILRDPDVVFGYDFNGRTLLARAARQGLTQTVQFLIDSGSPTTTIMTISH